MTRPYVTGMLYATAAALGIGAFWPAAGAGIFAVALIAFVATWVIRDGLPEKPTPPEPWTCRYADEDVPVEDRPEWQGWRP